MGFLFLRLKTKIFYWTFFSKFKLGFKKKGVKFEGESVQICISGGSKNFFL